MTLDVHESTDVLNLLLGKNNAGHDCLASEKMLEV